MLKRFFTSLYWKISAIFLLLLVVIGALYAYLTIYTVEAYVQEATQKVSAPLAQRIVDKVTMIRGGEVNRQVAEEVFVNAAMLNPGIEIYLLDPDGQILAASVDRSNVERSRIDLAPIRVFLETQGASYVAGDDPQNTEARKVFSASPVVIDGVLQGYVYVILRGAEYDSALSMLQDSYILRYGRTLLLISLIAAAVLGLIVIYLVTRKLRRMHAAVEAFERGDYDSQIPIRSNDELDRLASAFNSMARTTQRNVEAIKRSDDLRRELVANVSHDLRTPLASVQGYIETLLLKDDSLDRDERRSYLEIIRRATEKLTRLVGQLFELSKLDTRQVEPQKEIFNLCELSHDLIQKFAPQAEQRGIDLTMKPAPHVLFVEGDVAMLERAIENLVDNAIRYTQRTGRVRLAVEGRGTLARMSVSDDGSGIPADEIANIFDRFYRLDKSRSRHTEGAGLGLAITRKILEAHGGTIEVESKVGKGSTFTISLPLVGEAEPVDSAGAVSTV